MSVSIADLMEKMLEAGAPIEAVTIAIKAVESVKRELDSVIEHNRSTVRERVKKHRENKRLESCNVTETLQKRYSNDTVTSRASAHAGSNILPSEPKGSSGDIKNLEPNGSSQKKSGNSDFRAVLQGQTDDERIEAILAHRRTKRASMTAHSAKLFLRDAAAAGLSVSEAIDTCISRNWITVKADWLANSIPHRQSTSPPGNGMLAALDAAERAGLLSVGADGNVGTGKLKNGHGTVDYKPPSLAFWRDEDSEGDRP